MGKKVILFSSCSQYIFGRSQVLKTILQKLGYELIVPKFRNECCGLMYCSAGVPDLALKKREHLLQTLMQVSEDGKIPIITENASCVLELRSSEFNIFDALDFIIKALADYSLKQVDRKVMLHVNCSFVRLKEKDKIIALARRCAREVVVPSDIYCCGFAGSKGFTVPELNANALKTLKTQIPKDCCEGYTCLQACEIGLSRHSGISYRSIFDLILEAMC